MLPKVLQLVPKRFACNMPRFIYKNCVGLELGLPFQEQAAFRASRGPQVRYHPAIAWAPARQHKAAPDALNQLRSLQAGFPGATPLRGRSLKPMVENKWSGKAH